MVDNVGVAGAVARVARRVSVDLGDVTFDGFRGHDVRR